MPKRPNTKEDAGLPLGSAQARYRGGYRPNKERYTGLTKRRQKEEDDVSDYKEIR